MSSRKAKEVEVLPAEQPLSTEQPAFIFDPQKLVEIAITQKAGIEQLERIVALVKDREAIEARKAFYKAFAGFQSECSVIQKSKTVNYENRNSPGRTNYSYAGTDDIVKAVNPLLHKHGLSYRFEQSFNDNALKVTCILTHEAGHSESCAMAAKPDGTGNKNTIQQWGSSATYLKRYTLTAVLGLATTEEDDDGQSSSVPVAIETDANQLIEQIRGFITKRENTEAEFFVWASKVIKRKIQSFDELTPDQLQNFVTTLEKTQ